MLFKKILFFCLMSALLSMSLPTMAQEDNSGYRLGSGDEIQLSVIQQPSLDRTVTILPGGVAVFPMIGEVQLSGLSIEEAEELVQRRMQLFNNELVDITLTITNFNSMYVFILGEVAHPGRYSFAYTPKVWDVVRTAGGPLPTANIRTIKILSQVDGQNRSENYDLTPVLTGQAQETDALLHPGDTIIVNSTGGGDAQSEAQIRVFGAVAQPGTFLLTEPVDLVSVLMLAGGPVENSNLKKIHIVHNGQDGQLQNLEINLNYYLQDGDMTQNPPIYPGDTVRVEHRRTGFFMIAYPIILGTITTAAAIALAVNRLTL